MKRPILLGVAATVTVVACTTESPVASVPGAPSAARSMSGSIRGRPHGHPFGKRRATEASTWDNSPIQYNGGAIIYAQKVAALYWSSRAIYEGGPTPGTTGAGTADGSLVGYFLSHLGGSAYYNMNTSYYDGSSTHVQNSVTYTQYWATNTNVPAPGSNVNINAIEAQLEAGLTSGALTFDANTLYLVFTDSLVDQDDLYSQGDCAEHVDFSWSGHDVKFAAMPRNIDEQGCRPEDFVLGAGSPNGDSVADVEVNTVAHETEETNTDPDISAWYDISNGNLFENADKCAWMFSPPHYFTTANGAIANVHVGAKSFLVQEDWVNANGLECAVEYITPIVSGPSSIHSSGTYTWTATPVGTDAAFSITYQWSVKWLSGTYSGQTWTLGTGQSQSLGVTYPEGTFDMIVTVTNRGYTGTGAQAVYDGF